MLAQRHAILLTDGENHNESPEQLTQPIAAVTGRFQCDCRGVGVDWQVAEVRRIAQALLGHRRHHPAARADGRRCSPT